ncbi:sulfite exporter TauE/SafE family protein [Pseudolabrys taiwanensis]|uniref:Probable membrane transporter protein n=2 Tax=Pseudolabrys taiwanensis TaxID=331696 RepID=A0A345ZY63_9HYPH|nr:sulfite exporter TauE/SafE family protein [Pseudolabrys taiwanensis]
MLAAVAAAFFLAGTIKGVIGLGLPTVAVGLLGLLMPPAQAAAILIVPSLVTNIWQALVGGSALELIRRMWSMLVGICIGTVFGAVWLAHTDGRGAAMWLGVALVVYALLGLFNVHFSVPRRSEGWLGFIIGLTTGTVTVATGVFALPGVPYLHALNLDRDRLVQALGLSFTVSTVTLAAALFYAGEMHTSLAAPVVVALIAAPLGMVLGQLVRQRVRPETFRKFFFFSLLALGLHLALRGLL